MTAADRPSVTDNARAEQRSGHTVQQTAAHFARKVQRVSDRIRSTDYQRSVSDIVALDNVEGFLDRIARDDLDVFAAGRAERPACTWPRCRSPRTGKCFAWCKCICHEWSAAQQAAGRAETTIEATERIARQIAASTAMTGRDAREYVEAVQALQPATDLASRGLLATARTLRARLAAVEALADVWDEKAAVLSRQSESRAGLSDAEMLAAVSEFYAARSANLRAVLSAAPTDTTKEQ